MNTIDELEEKFAKALSDWLQANDDWAKEKANVNIFNNWVKTLIDLRRAEADLDKAYDFVSSLRDGLSKGSHEH